MDCRFYCKMGNYKNSRRYIVENLSDFGFADEFLNATQKS